MRIGLCGNLNQLVSGVPGLDYLEVPLREWLCPQEDDGDFRQRLKVVNASPVPVEIGMLLFAPDFKTIGPQVNSAILDAYMAIVFDRARQAGMEIIVYGSGKSRAMPEGFESQGRRQLVDHLRRWGPLAASAGVTLVLELLHKGETNIVNSLHEAAELVRQVGQPSIRVVADTYHMAKEGEGWESIAQAADLVVHAHCAESDGRTPLGVKGEDHRPYFKALKASGYDGRVSIEARFTDLPSQLPAAIAELRRQWETA